MCVITRESDAVALKSRPRKQKLRLQEHNYKKPSKTHLQITEDLDPKLEHRTRTEYSRSALNKFKNNISKMV